MIRLMLGMLLALSSTVALGAPEQQRMPASPAVADRATYLSDIVALLKKQWPANRTVNIVCHGHSVPAGYFKTPTVDTFNAYPYLLHKRLKDAFPYAVINVIVTAIGGENSEGGARRFDRDVLSHHPNVVTIDYGLNDRRIGLERVRKAWSEMIEKALAAGTKVILLTPTGDLRSKLDDPNDPLNQHAAQIRQLAAQYHVGLVDSLAAFQRYVQNGGVLTDTMSDVNHPNRKGHDLVVESLLLWFPTSAQSQQSATPKP